MSSRRATTAAMPSKGEAVMDLEALEHRIGRRKDLQG